MAEFKLAQKFKNAINFKINFKRVLTHLVLLSFIHQNLAFATQSIIELDFKDAAPSHRLQVMPRLSTISDVDHVEIDTDQQQVTVYRQEQQTNETEDLQEALEGSESVPRVVHPILIPKHDVHNLPWDLEPEKLTLFILQQTAWLTPLDEDGYKLEFRAGLLGGMFKSGGGKKELVVNVYPKGVDCGGRNDWPKGTIGDKYCRNNGNGSGNFGVQVFNKPYVPPVDKEWEKHCQKACNPFENQKAPYIPPLEDKKPELKKVSISSLKEPIFKADDKKIHLAVGKDVREVSQSQINKIDGPQIRVALQKISDFVMEYFAPYQGGEISQKKLDEIVHAIGLRIDPMMKDTSYFRTINPIDYYRVLDKDKRWGGKTVDEVSRKAVSRAYEGLKKQYAEELEKFRKNQKIEEEKQEKAKKEKAQKEEQQKKIQSEKQAQIVCELQKKKENPLLYADYEHMKHLQQLINTDSWENVFKYADKVGISRSDVLKIDRLEKMTFEGFMKKTNPFYESYEHKKHLQQLINTDSWENVFKYADKAGISRSDVLKVDRLEKMTFTGFMQKTNPFYGNYEKVKHIQTLIQTTTWEAVYNYADKQGFTKEEVQYVNSRRGETITFDNYMTEVFDDQVLEDWGVKDWKEAFGRGEDEVEFLQVGGKGDLVKEILKFGAQKGGSFLKKGWQKAVQAYKGDLVKGLKIDQKTLDKIPKELGDAKLAKEGGGLRWFDNKGNKAVRMMKGRKDAEYAHQQNDYVQLRSGGQVVLRDGAKIDKPISGQELRKLKDAHIPYEEWVKWRSWDKP